MRTKRAWRRDDDGRTRGAEVSGDTARGAGGQRRRAAARSTSAARAHHEGHVLRGSARAARRRGANGLWPRLKRPPRHGCYQPFLDYPFADALVILHAVAHKAYPNCSLLEALRLLGRDTVKVFLASRAGRVVRSMTIGARESLLQMPAMWKVTDPQNEVLAYEPEPGAVRFEVSGFPGWIDCGLIGTLEQVVINHRVEPVIDVELLEPMRGNFVVRWQ